MNHSVTTVPEASWSGISNGALLERAGGAFDVFVTVDKGIQYEQNLSDLEIAVILLRAPTNDISDLEPLVHKVLQVLPSAAPGTIVIVER